MPRRPAPLPPALAGRVFTRREALDRLSSDRLRSLDLRQVTHGAHRAVVDVPGSWAALGYPRPVAALPPEEAAVVVALTRGVASHLTAARLHGLVLPWWAEEDTRVHVSRPHRTGRTGRAGVACHGRTVPAEDRVEVHGVPVTSLERTWVDLCSLLRPDQVADAVVAGDALVNPPWVDGSRLPPRTTASRLSAALERAGRFKGVRVARAALALIRVGADSPPETRLRLALLDAGLPEPRLQAQLVSPAGERTDADMVVERSRVALHYDGGHHRTPEQQRRDARRDRLWQEAGHLSITVMGADLAEDFRTVVAAVVRHDRAARATSTISAPAPAAGLSNVKSGEWALSNVG